MLVIAIHHFIAGLPVETVREDVHTLGGAARQRNLRRFGVHELRHEAADGIHFFTAIVVRWVFRDLAEELFVGLGHAARHRTFGAVVHEGHAVENVELAADLPPIGLVERSCWFEVGDAEGRRDDLPAAEAKPRSAPQRGAPRHYSTRHTPKESTT